MKHTIKQISSLEKVRNTDSLNYAEITEKSALLGERISYQICIKTHKVLLAKFFVRSELAKSIKLYLVKDVVMDRPITKPDVPMDGYITHTPGLMPDLLVPLEDQGFETIAETHPTTIWVRVDVPENILPGKYDVEIRIELQDEYELMEPAAEYIKTMTIDVAPLKKPSQKLMYTRWFYADCIAQVHNVPIYSEKHWDLIEKYISAAADTGMNMILVPIHTPPLNTSVGRARPCVQLVDIEKKGNTYVFDFDKLRRFIDICKRNGIEYFEIAHLFSQWGAEFAPNIEVTENGKKGYMFGWHVKADSDEYRNFLKQYIAAVSNVLKEEKIQENTYFHISDEPAVKDLEKYRNAYNILKPLIGESKIFDALSNYEFYEKGLVECPVTNIEHIDKFLAHKIENQWLYYCVEPQHTYTNSFIAMKSCRTRILGFLLYKYDIKGFLHWGLNYYNSVNSIYPVNPYITTSADRLYPSGDAFILYPTTDGVYSSIRGEITYEAIQDMDICFALEKSIGRDAVIKMIDDAAGGELKFDFYPDGNEYIENLRAAMIEKCRKLAVKRF